MNRMLFVAAPLLAGLAMASCASTAEDGRDDDDDDATDTGSVTDGDSDSVTSEDSDSTTDSDSASDTDSGTDTECLENIDIVFVLDVSTTMGPYLETLEQEIGAVWTAAEGIDDNPHFGLVVFVDDVTVVNSGQSFATVADIQAQFNEWYGNTQDNTQTQSDNINGDFPENTLDALWAAATEYAWRDQETTLRVIIHATDDEFQVPPKAAHSYIQTIEKLQEQTIRVATFAAHMGGNGLDSYNVEEGYFTEFEGTPSIPDSTSGEVFDINEVGYSVSLADAINGFVLQELCEDYIVE